MGQPGARLKGRRREKPPGSAVLMIVSASYRTDIPAFYAGWFMDRLDAGFARVRNPYGGRPNTVSLRTGAVDGFVFWTRNAAPMARHWDQVRRVAPYLPAIHTHGLSACTRGRHPRAGGGAPPDARSRPSFRPARDGLALRSDRAGDAPAARLARRELRPPRACPRRHRR